MKTANNKTPGKQLELFDIRTAYIETPYELKKPDEEWKKFIQVCNEVQKLNEKINSKKPTTSTK